jgi:hypothetical protein
VNDGPVCCWCAPPPTAAAGAEITFNLGIVLSITKENFQILTKKNNNKDCETMFKE